MGKRMTQNPAMVPGSQTLKTLASSRQCQLVEELAAEGVGEKLSDTSHFHAWLDQHADEVKAIREAAATPPQTLI